MHFSRGSVLALTALIFHAPTAFGLHTQAGIVITPPPTLQPTICATETLLKRQDGCSFGVCGTQCLSQGAFCCGPAGTLATSPYWVCDNGACITSVRGSTGIVDCYDPDNPSGTTQSCIDHVPTAICSSTDRCYTCSSNQPFCHWETYIKSEPTTLRWFSCVSEKIADATFYAVNLTTALPTSTTSSSGPLTPTSTSTSTTSSSSPILSTGAIIGIAVGGGVGLIACVAIIAWCCISIRKKNHNNSPPPNQGQIQHAELAVDYRPTEMAATAPKYYMSQPVGSPGYAEATYYDEAGPPTPVAELPGRISGVGVTGIGKFEPQEGERYGHERETAYQGQTYAAERGPAHTREPEPEINRQDTGSRASYVEGDDWGHMSPAVGIAR